MMLAAVVISAAATAKKPCFTGEPITGFASL